VIAQRHVSEHGRVCSSPAALDSAGGPAAAAPSAIAHSSGGGSSGGHLGVDPGCEPIHLHHLRIRLAGVAASAAQQADEAANGATPVASASPNVAGLCMLGLGTPSGTPHHAQHAAQRQQQLVPVSGGAFGGVAAAAARAYAGVPSGVPSGGPQLFPRQVSLGVQDSLPFEWEPFGGAASMARHSNDDGGAFEALLR
jgi:hypothetical protein